MARFEGSDSAGADATVARIREQLDNPPPGLEGAKRILVLFDREKGLGVGMTFFETEEELRRGDEALNKLSPEGSAKRTGVEIYEVGLDHQFS